jgi:hypothetical protein
MRDAIVAASGAKGWEPSQINEFAAEVTGKSVEEWFTNPDDLNLILTKINEAK